MNRVADGEGPPLALYVHTPWCVRKCPYCDFNSHAAATPPPFSQYVARLLADLDQELRSPAARRPLSSVFIGGGTPSLFPGRAIKALLAGIGERTQLLPGAEITLEANPGAVDAAHFTAYRAAGVNRLSIGVQSLSARHLARLGRVHGPAEARAAVTTARAAGFDNLNLDMMFALPGQSLTQAAEDLQGLIALEPEHISYYQLTLEPNTAFFATPPELPEADLAADMGDQGRACLERAGFSQYEVSAFARGGRTCRHNLNYWRFGDYLGIGAGAHGKLTEVGVGRGPWRIRRTSKLRHPRAYLESPAEDLVASRRHLTREDCLLELALNALRLTDGFEIDLWRRTTGDSASALARRLEAAAADGLLEIEGDRVRPSELGRRFLDDLVARFAPDESAPGV